MKANDEIPQEFFNVADLFVRQANSLLKDWPRSLVSATLLYAAERFNAYNWLFREVDLDQTKEQAAEFYTSQYRKMFLDNVEQLRKAFTESGDLDDKGHPTIASRARSARSGPRAPEA